MAYTWVFAIATIAAFVESFNNGANDVSNAWAAAVASKAIPYLNAMFLAAIFETAGAISLGASNAETIKSSIINVEAFGSDPNVFMLIFTVVLISAASWGIWCTKHSLHVSSTYSLIGAVAGAGIATAGPHSVHWGWHGGKGIAGLLSGVFTGPAAGCAAGAIISLIMKLAIFSCDPNSQAKRAICMLPLFILVAVFIFSFAIVNKTAQCSPGIKVALALSPALVIASLVAFFLVPFLLRRILSGDGSLKRRKIFHGPWLLKRPTPTPEEQYDIPDYSFNQQEKVGEPVSADSSIGLQNLESETSSSAVSPAATSPPPDHEENKDPMHEVTRPCNNHSVVILESDAMTAQEAVAAREAEAGVSAERNSKGPFRWAVDFLERNPSGEGKIYEGSNLKIRFKRLPAAIIHRVLLGLHFDIHASASASILDDTREGRRTRARNSKVVLHPNAVEHVFTIVILPMACIASFAHGANDIGNAAGPWVAVYSAWKEHKITDTKAEKWQLAILSACICIGLFTYGYNIMKVMGAKLTGMTPSRASVTLLSTAITVLCFNLFSLPVSTSMCATGATVGVGLVSNTDSSKMSWKRPTSGIPWGAVNFQQVALLFAAWIITIPFAGMIAYTLMKILLNVPHLAPAAST